MKEVIISQSTEGQRLDKFLKRYLPNAPAGLIYKMLRKKNIVLNEKKASGSELINEGDRIRLFFSDETLMKFTDTRLPDYPSLDTDRIIYEDENILLYNKEAGLLTQQDDSGEMSLCELLTGYLIRSGTVNSETLLLYRPSAVNRLDRNTTGIVICAKTLTAARELSSIISGRSMKKEYLCVCMGRIDEICHINGRIEKEEKENKVIFTKDGTGEEILTIINPLSYEEQLDASLVCAELITGKTHQIRASMSYAGHPIAGDGKYGNGSFNKTIAKRTGKTYQLLHSYKLTFPLIKEGSLAYLSEKSFISKPDFKGLFKETIELICRN